ncbi:aldo/keto reductase, partial [Staphylococcus aureus]|uniref:aldo/keto reductase n=1 Tax=Staphylococcus aureus TaxID=1280 RepID=UPI00114D2961
LIDNRPESLLDTIHNNDVKVLARGPVSKGLLSSNSANELDNKSKDGLSDYSHDELGETTLSFKAIQSHLSALTFSYLTSHDVLGSIIVGASRVDQLKENIENYHTKVSLNQIKTARARVK